MNLRQGYIGNREGIALVVLIGVTNSAFLNGRRELYRAGNQAWLAVLAGAALSFGVFLIVTRAMRRRGCATLEEFCTDAMGTVIATLFGTMISVLFLIAAALPLSQMLLTLHRYIFVDAGAELIVVYMLLALLPLVMFGLESISRTAKLVCLPVLVSFLLMMLLGLFDYEAYRLYPLFGGGTKNFMQLIGISVLCFLPPLMLLLVCGRGVHGIDNAIKLGGIASLISGLFSLLLQLSIGAAFSYRQLRRIDVPVYQMILSVRGGMQMRLDKILLSVWMSGMLLGAAGLLYAASLQACQNFRLRDVRPVGAVFSVLCTTLVLVGQSVQELPVKIGEILPYAASVALLFVLLLPGIISFFKKERCLCESAV